MRFVFVVVAALASCLVFPAQAAELPSPEGEVILTVSGAIEDGNTPDSATFDMDMLTEMDAVSFQTTTLWTEGATTFTGVPLASVLDLLGVEDGMIRASAINDYTVEIPVESLTDEAPILAYAQNGEPMPRRQKGPLWVIYPYDSSADFRSEVVYSRSIWQLNRLEIVE